MTRLKIEPPMGESPNLQTRRAHAHAPDVFGGILASMQMNGLILQANILVASDSLAIA